LELQEKLCTSGGIEQKEQEISSLETKSLKERRGVRNLFSPFFSSPSFSLSYKLHMLYNITRYL